MNNFSFWVEVMWRKKCTISPFLWKAFFSKIPKSYSLVGLLFSFHIAYNVFWEKFRKHHFQYCWTKLNEMFWLLKSITFNFLLLLRGFVMCAAFQIHEAWKGCEGDFRLCTLCVKKVGLRQFSALPLPFWGFFDHAVNHFVSHLKPSKRRLKLF